MSDSSHEKDYIDRTSYISPYGVWIDHRLYKICYEHHSSSKTRKEPNSCMDIKTWLKHCKEHHEFEYSVIKHGR